MRYYGKEKGVKRMPRRKSTSKSEWCKSRLKRNNGTSAFQISSLLKSKHFMKSMDLSHSFLFLCDLNLLFVHILYPLYICTGHFPRILCHIVYSSPFVSISRVSWHYCNRFAVSFFLTIVADIVVFVSQFVFAQGRWVLTNVRQTACNRVKE